MPSIINATTTNGVAISPDNSGSLQLATNNGTTAVTIDTSQNVGVGNTPSGTSATGYRSLELGTTAGTGITAGNGDFYVPVNAYVAGGAWKYATTSTASLLNIQGGLFTWSNAGSGTAGNNISFSERMRITSGGNIGIGTTSPGNIRLLVTNNSTAEPSFRANNARATSGDVVAFLRLEANTNNTSSRFLTCSGNDVAGTGDAFIIYGNGNAVNVNGSYGTISDIKNKENIVDATPKLDKINQLQVRNFNFKGDDLKQIGFIAQEFEQVFPSMVDEHKDTDVEGNDLGTTTKSIKTSVLVPILVKAIQEQQAMIETLKTELDIVKAELNTLKNPPVEGTE